MRHSGLGVCTIAVSTLLTACGGGGGGSGAAPTAAGAGVFVPATLELVESAPANQEAGVRVEAKVRLVFDAPVSMACLEQPATGLFAISDDERIAGSFNLSTDPRVLTFEPSTDLPANSVLELRLSPLTCSSDGRLLERLETVRFRTAAAIGPSVLSCDPAEDSELFAGRPQVVVDFDCRVDASVLDGEDVEFRTGSGRAIPGELTVVENDPTDQSRVVIRPRADLPAEDTIELRMRGIRALGGALAPTRVLDFTTGSRGAVTTSVQTLEPTIQPAFEGWVVLGWNRSLDPSTLNLQSFVWENSLGGQQATEWVLSEDGRSLGIRAPSSGLSSPLQTLRSGPTPVLDSDGVAVQAFSQLYLLKPANAFSAPASSQPSEGESGVPTTATVEIEFDRTILAPHRSSIEWTQEVDGQVERIAVDRVEIGPTGRSLTIFGAADLALDANVVLTIDNGPFGLRSNLGVPASQEFRLTYRTSDLPDWALQPLLPEGVGDLPRNATFLVRSPVELSPGTVQSMLVRQVGGPTISSEVTLHSDGQTVVVRAVPNWPIDTALELVVCAGPEGVRSADGRWLGEEQRFQFRSGFSFDTESPRVELTVEGIPDLHVTSPQVPPHGFELVLQSPSTIDDMIDPRSVRIELTDSMEATRTFGFESIRVVDGQVHLLIEEDSPLKVGSWVATANASDLAGNAATIDAATFNVAAASTNAVPFERVQLVQVRYDLDRDGNGVGDFRQDLILLGLATASDPLRVDARMERIVRDGILSRAHQLFDRNLDGSRRSDEQSVPLRFTTETPIGVPYMEIACGGFDPEGEPGRVTGDSSSGTLGRAYFDARNSSLTQGAVATNPGLGVFPAEVYLFEARVHERLAPGFLTAFGRSFAPLSPDLGGTPLGSHPFDAVIMDPDFDPDLATSQQLARYRVVFGAADDWATVIGTVLAHEVGHAVGLTEPAAPNTGLHGDDSLHNRNSTPTDVMASTLGFDAMLDLDFEFRALNLAYLRHRVTLR